MQQKYKPDSHPFKFPKSGDTLEKDQKFQKYIQEMCI